MDRLRVGSFITGGRFVPSLDLNDGSQYALVRDTLTFTPPERKQQFSSSGRRYGGSSLASEVTDNGAVSAEWYVNGGTADASITLLENLLQQVEMISAGRFIEWQPEGSSRPGYYEIVGPASWEPMYRWIEFQGNKTLHVKAGWKVSPLVQGAPMEVLEDFTPRGTVQNTNYVLNPGGEIDASQWFGTARGPIGSTATLTRDTSAAHSGAASIVVTGGTTGLSRGASTNLGGGTGTATLLAKAGVQYTASAWIRNFTGAPQVVIALEDNFAGNGLVTSTAVTAPTGSWTQISVTWTPTVDSSNPSVYVYMTSAAATGAAFYMDGVTVVQGSSPADFDGDSPSSAWSGARGASTSVQYAAGTDTLSDFTVEGTNNMTIANGQLALTSAGVSAFATHTGRGYTYEDAQGTLKFTTGASVTGMEAGIVLRARGSVSYALVGRVFGGSLAILKRAQTGGGYTTLTSTAVAPAANTTYWIRFRAEGNVLFAEFWTTAPTPMGTPATSLSYTLTGTDITNYGAGVAGAAGVRITASAGLDDRWDDLTIEPFVYRNQTLPSTIQLGGTIPGTAPAMADVTVTPSGGTAAPMSAILGWAARPGNTGLAAQPFGIIEGEAATTVSTWAVTADANYRNGSGLKYTYAGSGSNYAEAYFNIDPSLLVPDDFTQAGEVAVEVWARMDVPFYPTAANSYTGSYGFTVAASVRPQSGLNYGAERWTLEYGSAGKLIQQPTVQALRFVRVGTLHLVADKLRPAIWQLKLSALINSYGGGSLVMGLDYIVLVPARRRAASPTGKVGDATYPRFVPSTSESSKVIRSDLSGALCQPPNNAFPDTGLGGQQIELPPGKVDLLTKLSSLVPDDPTLSASAEQLGHSATIKVSPTPRWFFARGS